MDLSSPTCPLFGCVTHSLTKHSRYLSITNGDPTTQILPLCCKSIDEQHFKDSTKLRNMKTETNKGYMRSKGLQLLNSKKSQITGYRTRSSPFLLVQAAPSTFLFTHREWKTDLLQEKH